jgi:secondary thiamine-phosphate synthase enzyme
MKSVSFQTKKKKQVLDITEEIEENLKELKADNGLCHLFVTHTTCCLTTADLDPGTDLDTLEAIEKIFPKGNYRHPHNPAHVGEHIMSSIIGSSLTIPVEDGKLILGTWQRIVLIELSGPRERKIILEFIKS